MQTIRESSTVKLISAAWREAGLRAPIAASPSSASLCCLPDCETMPFVQLRMMDSLRSLCLKHFESVKQLQTAAGR